MLCRNACERFQDREHGSFYLYSEKHETLILRPKETYDRAMPSINSLKAWNLVWLSQLVFEERYGPLAERQLDFLAVDASQYPVGHAMFPLAFLAHRDPPLKVTAVCSGKAETVRLPLAPGGGCCNSPGTWGGISDEKRKDHLLRLPGTQLPAASERASRFLLPRKCRTELIRPVFLVLQTYPRTGVMPFGNYKKLQSVAGT